MAPEGTQEVDPVDDLLVADRGASPLYP